MTIFSDQSPVTFTGALPTETDVVIIGGGVIGVSTALYLAEAGQRVLLCEKGRIAGEQSSRNWGWVRQQGRDPDELPIVMESLEIWKGLSSRVQADLGFTQKGVLYLADDQQELDELAQWMEVARPHQLDTTVLTNRQVDDLVTDNPGQFAGALYTASDGRAEPFVAVPAMARAAERAGAVIVENCAVRCLDHDGGRISGVVTESGPVRAGAVLLAGGAWSARFLGNMGIALPQLAVRSNVARTGPAPDICTGNAASADLAFRRRQDGGYTIALGGYNEHYLCRESFRHLKPYLTLFRKSLKDTKLRLGDGFGLNGGPRQWRGDQESPFEQTRVLNPPAGGRAVKLMRQRLARRLPALADIPFVETWAGMIDTMPDVVPVMDRVAGHNGLYLATGFSGHGFGIGPAAGRIMADMIRGRPEGHDLTRFRLSRFRDGSALELGPAL